MNNQEKITLWNKGNWELLKTKEYYQLVNNKTLYTDYPIKYQDTDDIAYNNPYVIPEYVKKSIKKYLYEVIASKTITNTISINIYNIVYGLYDKVLVGINNNKPRYYNIYSSNKGNYFNLGGRQYLSDFIRL